MARSAGAGEWGGVCSLFFIVPLDFFFDIDDGDNGDDGACVNVVLSFSSSILMYLGEEF